MTSLAERITDGPTSVGPAELRARRAASVVLGIAVLGFVVANLATAWGRPELLTHWWWVVTLSGRAVFGAALLVAAWFAGAGTLRALALGFALFGLVSVAASGFALATGMAEVLRDLALYAWAAALALPPVGAWAWILVTEILAVATRMQRTRDPIALIESSLVSFTTTMLLVILVMAVVRTAAARDSSEQSVLKVISEDVEQAASVAERVRLERVVHDDVLAALRAASLGVASERADAASMAATALDRLATLDAPPQDPAALLDTIVVVNRIRTLAASLAPSAEVHTAISGAPKVPGQAALAIAEACGEALRNSVLHAAADREVARVVQVRVTADAVEVVVQDDGEGFDPRAVPPDRLGIARSIVERMRAVPGGGASVRSAVGAGTCVTVSWHA